jgi:hypothetical protein
LFYGAFWIFFELSFCFFGLIMSGIYFVMAKKMRGCIVFIAQAWGAAASAAFGISGNG